MGIGRAAINRHKNMRGFYRNSFLCNPAIMINLMKLMNQAIELSLLDDEISKMMSVNSGYGRPGSNVTQRIFGSNYYEYYPFIFER